MSLTALAGNQPTPTLSFNFENTATDTMTGLAPSTVNGAPTYVAGKFGQGINFPNPIGFISANNFVYNTTPTFSNTVGFTFTAWVNFTQPYAASNQYLFSLYGGTPVSTSTSAFYLVLTAGGNVGFRNSASSSGAPLTNIPFTPVVGQWNHYALSVTATNWNMYINGAIQTGSGAYVGANLTNITGPMWLGGSSGLNSPAMILDDFRLYNRALTDAQILTIFQAGGVPAPYSSIDNRISVGPNLPGGSIRDFSATPITLATYGTPAYNTSSPFVGDGSFVPSLNGSAYIIDPSVTKLNFDFFSSSSNSFCEVWIYFVSGTNFNTYPSILFRDASSSATGDGDWGWATSPTNVSGVAVGVFFDSGSGTVPNNRVGPTGIGTLYMQPNQWNHVSMSWATPNAAGGTGTVYISVNGTVTSGTRNLSVYPSRYTSTARIVVGRQVWESGSLFSNFRLVNLGSNTLPYTTTYTIPTSPLGLYAKGTTALLIRSPAPSISVIADYSPSPVNLATFATDMTYVPTLSSGPFASSPIEGSFLPAIFTDNSTLLTTAVTKLNYDFFSASSNSFMEFWWFAPAQTTTYSRFWMRSTGLSGNSNSWGDFQLSISPSPGAVGMFAATSATTQVSLNSSQNYNLNAWNHISLSWNSTNSTAYISTNGTVSSLSLSGRPSQFVSNTPIKFCTQFDPGSLISNFRVVSGPATLPYIANFAPPTSPLGLYPTGTTVLLMRSVNPTMQLTGTPILSQLSVAPVAAFSLRAVGGTTARAVNVQAYPVVQWPPVNMTSNATVVSSQAYGNGTYYATESTGQSNTVTTPAFTMFDNDITTYYEQFVRTSSYYYNGATGALTGATGTPPVTIISTVSVSGWWVQIQAPTSFILRNYTIVGRQTNNFWTFRVPNTFWIAGSNDGTTWSNVHYQAGITFPPQSGKNYTVPLTSNSVPYSYYRMVVSVIGSGAGNANDILNIASWNLYGDSPSYTTASSDFYADRLGNLLTAPVTGTDLATWLGGSTGSVATWYDQSGNGNHAIQGTQANRPVIQKGTKGPGYSVLFNGTTNNLILGSGSFLSNTPYSVSTVERRNTASFPMFFFGRVGGASITGSLHIGYVNNTALRFGLWATSSSTDEAISAYAGSAEPVGYNIQTFSTTSFMRNYRNAVLGSNNASTTPITNTDGTYSIGLVSTNYYSGEMYEILVFTKSLYDLDGTSSITQIYNNQLSYTGL